MLTEKIVKLNGGIELRSVVKFCFALNKSSTGTLGRIKSTGKYDNAVQVLFINGTRILGAEENQLRTISGAANRIRYLFH